MSQHDISFEVACDLCWHDNCQVVVITVDILSSHFLLDVDLFDFISILDRYVEVTRAENVNRLFSVVTIQGNSILESLLNLD